METSSLIRRCLVIAGLLAATAHGEPRSTLQPTRPWTGYIRVPVIRLAPLGIPDENPGPPPRHPTPAPGPVSANSSGTSYLSSRLVFLNRCSGGCQVSYAMTDDSRMMLSSIAGGSVVIPEFSQGDQVWNEVLDCVRETFAPFNIEVTDQNPGTTVSYFMNLVGGRATDLRSDLNGAGGVAPFTCSEIPNAITYTFDVYGPNSQELCWTAAQEVAHAFGLDHEYLTKDPMTYLDGDLPKRFRDVDAPCGRLQKETCMCGAATQNSYRRIVGLFGPGAPTAPDVMIRYPVSGTKTQPGFAVAAKATDDVRVTKVEAYIDGALAGMSTMPYGDVFEITTSTDLAQGAHELEVKAYDVQDTPQSATLSFDQGPPCKSDGCSGTNVCVEGICIPGPDEPGGLGAICTSDTECLSHLCLDGSEKYKHCVAACELGNNASCPEEFACADAGGMGVCWPTPGGCCDTGTSPQGPLLVGLGVGLLLLRRRRK